MVPRRAGGRRPHRGRRPWRWIRNGWERIARTLSSSHRPLILAGQGCAGASELLRALAERLGAPVVTSTSGRGVLPEDHPLALGFEFVRGDLGVLNELGARGGRHPGLGLEAVRGGHVHVPPPTASGPADPRRRERRGGGRHLSGQRGAGGPRRGRPHAPPALLGKAEAGARGWPRPSSLVGAPVCGPRPAPRSPSRVSAAPVSSCTCPRSWPRCGARSRATPSWSPTRDFTRPSYDVTFPCSLRAASSSRATTSRWGSACRPPSAQRWPPRNAPWWR